jgi:tetratricopeptide (TPR) repeat protein
MKRRHFLLMVFFTLGISCFAALVLADENSGRVQGWGDTDAAMQYAKWTQQAVNEGRWSEALAGLERASDFVNVSSDISYMLALARSNQGKSRIGIVEALDKAVEINRWVLYNKNDALLLKTEQLIAMRNYYSALVILGQTAENADSAMLRLRALYGLILNNGNASDLVQFRNLMLSVMEKFPEDTRPLRIFFEYARNRTPEPSALVQSDLNLLNLALRKLSFILETDPELAWIAAPFIGDTGEARRLTAYYRTGGIPNIRNRDFYPSTGSIPIALNLGLINDTEAAEELFSGSRGFNSPLPPGIKADGNPVLDKRIVTEVYDLLRSEAGREFFTAKLLSFSGLIISDEDNDGYFDSRAFFNEGVIHKFEFDRNQENTYDIQVSFSTDGVPVSAEYPVTGHVQAAVVWERYPSVRHTVLEQEKFTFPSGDFQFAPVSFIVLGGSRNRSGLLCPVLSYKPELTRRSMVSFCTSITRPSIEFNGAVEQIFFQQGFPWQAVEILNGNNLSVTEFEKGIPIIQYIDLDLDGRMETIRRFHRPGTIYPWPDSEYTFDYRRLVSSSESDWTGEGRYKTGEVYLKDGSIVYSWDIDGSGIINYSETDSGKR